MLRHVRRSSLCVLTLVLALSPGTPAASSAIGLQSTALGCSDGTNLGLTLDPAATLLLTDAVSAVSAYPAGDPPLSCALSPAPASSPNGPKDFVVGGGQAAELGIFGNNECDANLSVSAHVPTGTPAAPPFAQSRAGGTFNLTNTQNKCMFSGHIVSKVDCVQVGAYNPGSAQITAVVTKADGAYSGLLGLEIEVDFLDSGQPGGAGDMVDVFRLEPAVPCLFGDFTPIQPLDRGNINVRQASS
jgi:hypothetical protein